MNPTIRQATYIETGKNKAKDYGVKPGDRYGKLVVIKRLSDRISISSKNKTLSAFFMCKCDCGNDTIVNVKDLIRHTNSCGCLKKNIGLSKITHNCRNSPMYGNYKCMVQRCYDPNFSGYKDYGAKGIKICREWYNPNYKNGFDPECVKNFCKWAYNHPTYKPGYSIDRINPNKDYYPENCRWANSNIQSNNKKSSTYIEFNNDLQTIGNWERISNHNPGVIRHRLNNGWNIEEAIFIDNKKDNKKRLINAIYFVDNYGTYITEDYAEELYKDKFKTEENYMPNFKYLIKQ